MGTFIRRIGAIRESPVLVVGAVLMLGSVLCIALGSIFAKTLLAEIPAGQVLWLRFFGFIVVMAPIALATHGKELIRPHLPKRQILRGVLGLAVALLILLAIREIGVSQAIAAFYVYPAVSYVISILWLGERSSLRTWAAVGAGFLGVVIVLNPDARAISAGVIFAIVAAVLASARIALHKADSKASSPMVSAFWDRGVGAVLATFVIAALWIPIDPSLYPTVAGLVLSSVGAQLLFVYAISMAPLGALAPFTYWEVVFVFALDVLILGAALGRHMAIGGALIVASGLALSLLRRRNEQIR